MHRYGFHSTLQYSRTPTLRPIFQHNRSDLPDIGSTRSGLPAADFSLDKAPCLVFVVADDTATETDDREVVYTGCLPSYWVAGLAVSLSQSTHNFDHFNVLQLRGIPVVFFDRIGEEIEASNVVVDDYHDAFDVVNHLVNSGYRRIAHLAGPKNLFISKLRLKDYKDGPKASDGSDKWQS